MLSRTGSLQLRQCGSSEIGIDSRDGKDWPPGEVLVASVPGPRKEHDEAPEGVAESYRRFLARARAPLAGGLAGDGPRSVSGPGVADGTGPAVSRS